MSMINSCVKKQYIKPKIISKKLIRSYFKTDTLPLFELEGMLLAATCITCGPCGGKGCTPICR